MDILTFTAQGKYKDYPGKSTVIDELEAGKEVELTFIPEEKKLIIVNPYGEISGCIPSGNPEKAEAYTFLRVHMHAKTPMRAMAIPHGVLTYDVQVTIQT